MVVRTSWQDIVLIEVIARTALTVPTDPVPVDIMAEVLHPLRLRRQERRQRLLQASRLLQQLLPPIPLRSLQLLRNKRSLKPLIMETISSRWATEHYKWAA